MYLYRRKDNILTTGIGRPALAGGLADAMYVVVQIKIRIGSHAC